MAEYAALDMQWFEEARTAVRYYRQGQEARRGVDKARAELRAG
jgi:hypothetical protein